MTGPDVAVVGLGAMGSAAAYQLAKRGARVIGLDRYEPPHALGSSHGETRITRQAVGEGSDYVPLVLASHRIWRELEGETGQDLLRPCGAILIAPGSGTTSHHGKPDFVGRSIAAAQAFGIAHEVMTGAEAARRFPQFRGLRGDEKVYFEPSGGYLRPECCIAAQLSRAAALGADLRTGTEVFGIEAADDGVRIRTGDGHVFARYAVVSAGAWTASLLGPPFDRLLTVNRQVLHWFELDEPAAFDPGSPVFIWMHGPGDSDYFYGFPPLPGEARIKVASEQYAAATTPACVDRTVKAQESEQMYRVHVEARLAGVAPRVAGAAACLYTTTPDRDFIVDWHPRVPRALVVSACSGHGFKHSAGIGEAVAETILDGRSRADLTRFGLARFETAPALDGMPLA